MHIMTHFHIITVKYHTNSASLTHSYLLFRYINRPSKQLVQSQAAATTLGVAAVAALGGAMLELPAAGGVVLASFLGSDDGGGLGFIWGGGLCLSFRSIWRILERSVGFPGLGPWITTIEGFFSLSFFPFFSIATTSWGISSPIAFQ